MKKDKRRDLWIKETQMFQRVAQQPVDSDDVLGKAYDDMMGYKPTELGPISDAIKNFRKS